MAYTGRGRTSFPDRHPGTSTADLAPGSTPHVVPTPSSAIPRGRNTDGEPRPISASPAGLCRPCHSTPCPRALPTRQWHTPLGRESGSPGLAVSRIPSRHHSARKSPRPRPPSPCPPCRGKLPPGAPVLTPGRQARQDHRRDPGRPVLADPRATSTATTTSTRPTPAASRPATPAPSSPGWRRRPRRRFCRLPCPWLCVDVLVLDLRAECRP
jgi:hypothetical protein